jgi:hypothetical protein
VDQKNQQANEKAMAEIGGFYSQTSTVEKGLITQKMVNMKVVSDAELEGISFLQDFGQVIRESESINAQINSIQ